MRVSEHAASFAAPGEPLAVGGVPLDRLALRVGATPFFAYDRALVTERVATLRALLPESMDLGYAVKANPMPALVQHMSGLVDTLDVASAGELAVALDTGTAPERITFAGPGKTDDELVRAVAAGVLVEAESTGELERLHRIGERIGVAPEVAVRVNPDFAVRGSGMRMGGGPQQFGIDAEAVPAALMRASELGLRVRGFHVFSGSQNLSADMLTTALDSTVDLVLSLAAGASDPVTYVNLGGGFGIPYFEKDRPLDVRAVTDRLHELVDTRLRPALGSARIGIELGRHLVGEAGLYVTRVVDRKVSRGATYLVVDGGMHHQLAASGNFGQVIRRNYPLALASGVPLAPDGAEDEGGDDGLEEVTVVGSLCTPLDLLGDRVRLPRADVGDLVVIFQAGAYGLTASPTAFLGHPAPPEVLV